jgi:prepilin-type N-terminal cleavage/methylation domain-containing protein
MGKNMNNRGFTMIEAVIVTAILGIIAVMGFSFIASSANTYVMATSQGKTAAEVYAAMNRITRELQYSDVNAVTAPTRTADGVSAASGTLTFTTITNNSTNGWNSTSGGCTNCVDHATSITYSWDGASTLTRTTATSAQTLADGITDFTVTMTMASRAAIAGGLGAATTAASNIVQLNASDTITPGQATNLLLTVGGQTARLTNYISSTHTGTINSTWAAGSALGTAYTLSAKYLTITITKTDAASGASVTLTQSVYPNPNLSYPVN